LSGALFCSSCGQSVSTASPAPPANLTPAVAVAGAGAVPAQPVYVAAPPALPYAGFWLRFAAYLVDSLLVGFVFGVIAVIGVLALGGMAFLESIPDRLNAGDPAVVASLLTFYGLFILVAVVGGWLYFALMESSERQATLGKLALGLTVTNDQLQRMTFGRATGRYFAKIITGLIPFGIGYMMAGFTEKKQALHDMIASTFVFKKS
jgi:uncharacterized RDD family membrane protein YckC